MKVKGDNMKKTMVLIILAVAMLGILGTEEEVVLIPKDAIRFRVIASSNKEKDQALKKQVAKNLQQQLRETMLTANNLNDSRKMLKKKLPEFSKNIENTLTQNKSNATYDIDYGTHYFPEKKYKGVVYEEGMYESLVVTLGNGKGKNFWCVLFPPLCLLEAEDSNEQKDVEYKSFVKEVINKYFH